MARELVVPWSRARMAFMGFRAWLDARHLACTRLRRLPPHIPQADVQTAGVRPINSWQVAALVAATQPAAKFASNPFGQGSPLPQRVAVRPLQPARLPNAKAAPAGSHSNARSQLRFDSVLQNAVGVATDPVP